jgi:hypothetical protein
MDLFRVERLLMHLDQLALDVLQELRTIKEHLKGESLDGHPATEVHIDELIPTGAQPMAAEQMDTTYPGYDEKPQIEPHTVLYVNDNRIGIVKDVQFRRPVQAVPGICGVYGRQFMPSSEAGIFVTLDKKASVTDCLDYCPICGQVPTQPSPDNADVASPNVPDRLPHRVGWYEVTYAKMQTVNITAAYWDGNMLKSHRDGLTPWEVSGIRSYRFLGD